MSSYASTKTILTQEDKSVTAAGDAQNVLGSGAKLTSVSDGSVLVGSNTRLGDIVFNQFPEQVQATIGGLIKSVDTTAKSLSQSLSEQRLGGEANIPKIIMYLLVGGGVLFVASRILK